MTTYASTAQQILNDTAARQPDWVRERIRESDELRDQLEAINLREANEGKTGEHHAPALLRLQVRHLVDQMNLDKRVPQYPTKLLDLVFEIQDALFEMGGYRKLWEPEEEEGW